MLAGGVFPVPKSRQQLKTSVWCGSSDWFAPEVSALLDRFVDWRTCEAALLNLDPEVREMALNYLREFAADGDPFSKAILEDRDIPQP